MELEIIAGGTPTFPIHAMREGVTCSPGTLVLWDYGYSDIIYLSPKTIGTGLIQIRIGAKKSDLLFSPDTLLMPSSEGISVEVRQNPNAIGYDGLGYVTDDQKMVAVAVSDDGPYVLPSIDSVNDDSYPISRPLFMYTAGEPTGEIKAYMDWIAGDGQALVPKLGFVPLH